MSEKLSPAGRVPVLFSVAVGKAEVLTVKPKAVPAVSVTVAELVKTGALLTVSVKAWLTVPVEFLAVKVSG